MLKDFIKYINQNNLLDLEDKVLLAVSGGVDSMVMCDLFLKSNYKFGIAHCNFQLREKESYKDELLVKEYAQQNNIPFHIIHFKTTEYAQQNNLSIQMAARELRYNWFNELIKINNYNKLAVAHHADDTIETFFVNLTRGTGLKGLCGIPLKNKHIIRPILFATKEEIKIYAKTNNISFRDDATNFESKYARNRIRLKIIPEFEKINNSFKQTMLNNLSHIQEIEKFVEFEMDKLSNDLFFKKDDKIYIKIEDLRSITFQNLFLYYFLQKYGFKNDIINQIVLSLDTIPGKQFHSKHYTLIRDRNYLIISNFSETENISYIISKYNGEIIQPIRLSYKLYDKKNDFKLITDQQVAQIDFNKLRFPLILRNWQHGDYFIPFGMKGRKKLSDFFSDNKYSLFDKKDQWVLTSDNNIVWIVGKRIDDRFKIDEYTKIIWQIEIKQ